MTIALEGRGIVIREAELEDANFILALRLDEERTHFLGKIENDLEKQKQYLVENKKKKDDLYFIVENMQGERFGTARIYNITAETFTYGSWIIRKDAPYNIAIETYFLVSDCAYYVLRCQRAEFDVMKMNESVVNFHQRMGSLIVSQDEHRYYFRQTLFEYAVMRKKYKRYVVPDPMVFLNSTNSNVVNLSHHDIVL